MMKIIKALLLSAVLGLSAAVLAAVDIVEARLNGQVRKYKDYSIKSKAKTRKYCKLG